MNSYLQLYLQDKMGNELCCDPNIEKQFRRGIPKKSTFQSSQWPQDDQYFSKFLEDQNQKLPKDGQVYKHNEKDKYYFGNWDEEVPTGKSIFYNPDELLFIGQFSNGKPNGECQIRFLKEKNQFKGNIENGKAKGRGKYFNLNEKYHFQGFWEDSTPSEGTLNLENDFNIDKIEFSDYKNGKGTIYYRDKRQYSGQINTRKLKPHDEGIVKFPEENKKDYYQGKWLNGQMHGLGKLVWKDGSYYEGEYSNGLKDGKGKFVFPSKKCYEGYWVQGKQEGSGVLWNEIGTEKKRGKWKNGVFEKELNEEDWRDESISDDQRLKNRRSAESSDVLKNSFKENEQKKEDEKEVKETQNQNVSEGEKKQEEIEEGKGKVQQNENQNKEEEKKEDRREENEEKREEREKDNRFD